MKKLFLLPLALALCLLLLSNKPIPKLPLPVISTQEARKLILGKIWKVVAVATISGSSTSYFDEKPAKNAAVELPDIAALKWLVPTTDENWSEFTNNFYTECFEISLAFNNDSLAVTTGLAAKNQVFSIQNNIEEDKPNGLNFTLSGEDQSFAELGVNTFTATYYILGADEKYLYVLTPNKLNDLKVVFLLKAT